MRKALGKHLLLVISWRMLVAFPLEAMNSIMLHIPAVVLYIQLWLSFKCNIWCGCKLIDGYLKLKYIVFQPKYLEYHCFSIKHITCCVSALVFGKQGSLYNYLFFHHLSLCFFFFFVQNRFVKKSNLLCFTIQWKYNQYCFLMIRLSFFQPIHTIGCEHLICWSLLLSSRDYWQNSVICSTDHLAFMLAQD